MKKDFNKLRKSIPKLEVLLSHIINDLAHDRELAAKYRDHTLIGEWIYHRECHVKSDLLLIYRKYPDNILKLVRLSSHSELGF